MKKNFYWFACFACATVALAFSSCNDDKIEPDIEVPTEVTGVYIRMAVIMEETMLGFLI